MSGLTATVEVLTAEVRTLMVGSRQVTQSVYKQLDSVLPDECEPFGRVHDPNTAHAAVAVVGRDAATGALVRSSCSPPPRFPLAYGGDWEQWCLHGGVIPHAVRIGIFGGVEVSYKVDRLDAKFDARAAGGWCYGGDDARQAIEEQAALDAAYYVHRKELHESWKALPLIVLAGLR